MDEQEQKAKGEKWHIIRERLAWFVTNAPLYHVVKVPMIWAPQRQAYQILPDTVTMQCDSDKCPIEPTNWDRKPGGFEKVGTLDDIQYECRNCKESSVTLYFHFFQSHGAETHFEKVGRHPKFEVRPPKELGKALGMHRDLYIKGMTSRHHGFGLGALVYFRRVVEETTGELLDLMETTVKEMGGDEAALTTIKEAKLKIAFDDKVKVAAKALPSHIRPGGVNPLDTLHDLLSDGIHAKTDEEAIGIVDGIESVLEYLFTELKAHTEERKTFTERINQLTVRLKKAKEKSG